MKLAIAFLALAAIPAFSQTAPAARKTAPKKTVKAAPATATKTRVIPKDATQNTDGTYSWTDKAGKKWIFTRTPFGVSQVADNTGKQDETSAAEGDRLTKAVEVGEKVRFERQSPFGTKKWEKNKADLTEDERRILAQQAPAKNE